MSVFPHSGRFLFQGKSVHNSAIFAAILDIAPISIIAANMAEEWTDFPWKRLWFCSAKSKKQEVENIVWSLKTWSDYIAFSRQG